MSQRELAKMHGIANHSLVSMQARKGEWARKRDEYRRGVADSAIARAADMEGYRRAQEMRVRDHAIEAIDEAIQKMRDDLKRTRKELVNGEWQEIPIYTLRPHDITELIDKLQVLFNRPSTITEERSLGLSFGNGNVPIDLLRGIAEATRGLESSGAERSPIPRLDRAREN